MIETDMPVGVSRRAGRFVCSDCAWRLPQALFASRRWREAGSLAKHVIRPGEVKPGWAALYVVTVAMQAFCAFVRGMASLLVLFLAFTLLGWSTAPLNMIALIIGYGPPAISVAAAAPVGSAG